MFRRYTDSSLRSDQILFWFPSHPVWHINESYGFVTRLRRRVPLVEQELLTLPEHLSSSPILSGIRVTRSLVLCVCFLNNCVSFCPFSLGHRVVCPFSIYDSDYPFGIFKLFFRRYYMHAFSIIEWWNEAQQRPQLILIYFLSIIYLLKQYCPKKAQIPIRFCIINIDGNNVVEEHSSYT